MKPLLIVGSSGHSGCVIECVELCGEYRVLGLLDSFEPRGSEKHGYQICGAPENAAHVAETFSCRSFVLAVGDNWSRWRLATALRDAIPDVVFATILHPSVLAARNARIGPGSVVFAGSVIGNNAFIGEGCIVNTSCSVNHDCRLEDYSSISGGVHLGGATIIGERSSAGIGATLREQITIGRDTVIGAGAVVVHDLPEETVAFGVPAKVRRSRKPDEPYMF